MAAPRLTAQLARPTLEVCAGAGGLRLAFVGDGHFEPVDGADGLTLDEAWVLYKAATASLDRLERVA